MKTNSKEVKQQIKAHILEHVTNPETDEQFNTLEEAKEYVKKEFDRVANYPYNLKRFPNNQERFSDYLCGLPFSFEYSYYDIQNYLNSLGINPENKEYTGEQSTNLYHHLIYREIFS